MTARGRAETAFADQLAHFWPRKPRWSRMRQAERICDRLERAAACYEMGAAAAIFDVLRMCDEAGAPLPGRVAGELGALAALALSNETMGLVRGERPALAKHRAALKRRLRWHAVQQVLDDAETYEDSDAHAVKEWGACPEGYAEWVAERGEASPQKTRACEIALKRLGEGMVGWRAIHMDWGKVSDARETRGWPSIYFCPSAATLEMLEWVELLPLVTNYGACDSPDLGMI